MKKVRFAAVDNSILPGFKADSIMFHPKTLRGLILKADGNRLITLPFYYSEIKRDWRDAIIESLSNHGAKRLELSCKPDPDFLQRCNSIGVEVCWIEL